jgi:hypothetical protein
MDNDRIKNCNIQNLLNLGLASSFDGERMSIQQLITNQLINLPVLKLQSLLLSTKNKYLKEAIEYAITLRLTAKDELIELNTFYELIRDFELEYLQELSQESKNLFIKALAEEIIAEAYFMVECNFELQEEFIKKKLMED